MIKILCILFKTKASVKIIEGGGLAPPFAPPSVRHCVCCFYEGGISHNKDIMHSFQKFIVCCLIPNYPLLVETRIWKLVVRALSMSRLATSRVISNLFSFHTPCIPKSIKIWFGNLTNVFVLSFYSCLC